MTKPYQIASFRNLFRVAAPLIITAASFTLLTFSDRMFLAQYDPIAIQAVVPSGILCFTLVSFFMALCSIANSFVAQYYGAGEYTRCASSVAQALWMAIFSIPFIWALIPVGIALLEWSGHAPAVLAQEKSYLSIMLIGGVNVPLASAASCFFGGRGKTWTIMVAHLVSCGANILLNWFLIFGHGPFPALGIRGAAIASLIAGFLAPAILLACYFSKSNRETYQTAKQWRFERPLFMRMLRFGLPAGFHMVLDVGSFSVFTLLLGRLDEVSFMASNIVLSINMIAFMPSIGVGQAASVLVGQCMGAQDVVQARVAAWRSVWVAWAYTFCVVLMFFIIPDPFIQVFSNTGSVSPEVLRCSRLLLFLAAGWGLLEATNSVLSGALRGAGDTHFVMWYHTVVAWGFFALGEAMIVLVFKLNVVVAWSWAVIYFALLAGGWVWRMKSGRWEKIELIERAPTLLGEGTGELPL